MITSPLTLGAMVTYWLLIAGTGSSSLLHEVNKRALNANAAVPLTKLLVFILFNIIVLVNNLFCI